MKSNQSDLLNQQCVQTKAAAKTLAQTSTELRNQVLCSMANQLGEQTNLILSANQNDLNNAREQGLNQAMIDRLTISSAIISQMQQSLMQVVELDDPLKMASVVNVRPNGLRVCKKRIPLGVILMIYESRPNVTVEAAALSIKSGNAIILRGGKEAFHSNQAIAKCWQCALLENSLEQASVRVIETIDRNVTDELLKLDELIDVVIPRGGEGLIRHVVANSHIPVIKHYKGVCHLFVDEFADQTMALNLLVNGKTQRPGVCNALEGLIVHRSIAEAFLLRVYTELSRKDVIIFGCDETLRILPSVEKAKELDFHREFLDLKIACKVVDDLEQAITFIDLYGSGHTEVIVTGSTENAQRFVDEVDASVVMVNASSRFSDGGELGLGAEIGISTSKIHAYGPMGLESLTAEKFVVMGQGQVRQ